MSHPWGAVGLLGIQQYILGVKPIKPQHELVQIKPLEFNGKLTSAKGVLPTDRGSIQVEWKRENNKYILKVTLPDNVKANVYVPKSGTEGTGLTVDGKTTNGVEDMDHLLVEGIGSGTHTFERVAKAIP